MNEYCNHEHRIKVGQATEFVLQPVNPGIPKFFHPCRIALLITFALLLPHPSLAENQAEVLELDTIDVVGTRPLSGIGVPINQVPANVQVVSGKSIETQHSLNIAEYLDGNLGSVRSNDTVGNPYQADVIYRGFTASPLLGSPQGMSVFVDGVRVNEPFGDVVNWDLIPSNAIANINLIPGSNPLFGLNTLGGAIAVHTKSGDSNPDVSASVTGGSWGRRAVEFEAGGRNHLLDYFVAANVFREDGWRTESSSEVRQFFNKLGWQDDRNNLDLTVMLADNTMKGVQGLPLEMLANSKQAYTAPDNIENQLAMITLNGSHYVSESKLVEENLYMRQNRANGFNSNVNNDYPGDGVTSAATSAACTGVIAPSPCDPYASNVVTSTDTNGYGGSLQLTSFDELQGHKNQVTGGFSADLGRASFNSDTQLANIVGFHTVSVQPINTIQTVRLASNSDYYGLYGSDTFSVTDTLHLTLSGRYNLAIEKLSGSSLDIADDTLVPGNLDGNHRYTRFNPAIGLNLNPRNSLNLYAGYNEGMRAPSPVELACADPDHPCALPNAFGGDPNLEKVVSRTWEGGVRVHLSEQVNWNAGFFRTENSDDIQFIASGSSGNGYFRNVGTTRRQGMELGLNGKSGKFGVAANYSYVDATFQTAFTESSSSNSAADANGNIQVTNGDAIPGVSRHTIKLRLDYEITPAWSVGGNIVATSSQYARGDENNQDVNGKVPGYTVVNVDSRYSISHHWKAFAKMTNIFDRRFSTFGLLGVNEFTGPGNSFSSDPAAWNNGDQFRIPAAPRAGWVGITYLFN